MRPMPPPRAQTTIWPVKVPAGAAAEHRLLLYGAADACTTGSGPTPEVIDAPVAEKVSPLPAVRESCDSKSRRWVDAATVVTHGPPWPAVAAPGPSLPAEAATKTPAL